MKVGRNEDCPCGSGKKFKHCCANNHSNSVPISDRDWYEKNVVKNGSNFLYGRLQQDMETIPADEFWSELRRNAEAYLNAGPQRAKLTQQKVDAETDGLIARDTRYGYPAPFCHKGCANCCHELVYCTDEEATQISSYCVENKIPIDFEKLKRQLDYVEFDSDDNHTGATTWNDQPAEDQSCVFLNSKERYCEIWPVRPLVCRVHLAEETDQYCKPYNGQENPNALGISYIELSYILSVVFTVHQDSIRKTMGQLLLSNNFSL